MRIMVLGLAVILMCLFNGCAGQLKMCPVKNTPLFQVRERGHAGSYGGTLSPNSYWYEDNYNRYHRDSSKGARR